MSNSKNLIITVLTVALIGLAGWTYYTLTTVVPAKAEAECKATIDTIVIPEVTAQVSAVAEQECAKVVTETVTRYETVLEQLKQIPECAAALSSEASEE